MATPNNRRTVMTKKLLKTSLIELMQEKPLGKITIKELCEQAELNRSTFYLHYVDQFELLKDVEDEVCANALKHLEKVDSNQNSKEYVIAFLEYMSSKREAFRVLFCNQETDTFQALLVEGIMDHLKFSLTLTLPPMTEPYVYAFLIQGCLGMLRAWIKEDFDMSSKALADLIFRLPDSALASFATDQA